MSPRAQTDKGLLMIAKCITGVLPTSTVDQLLDPDYAESLVTVDGGSLMRHLLPQDRVRVVTALARDGPKQSLRFCRCTSLAFSRFLSFLF